MYVNTIILIHIITSLLYSLIWTLNISNVNYGSSEIVNISYVNDTISNYWYITYLVTLMIIIGIVLFWLIINITGSYVAEDEIRYPNCCGKFLFIITIIPNMIFMITAYYFDIIFKKSFMMICLVNLALFMIVNKSEYSLRYRAILTYILVIITNLSILLIFETDIRQPELIIILFPLIINICMMILQEKYFMKIKPQVNFDNPITVFQRDISDKRGNNGLRDRITVTTRDCVHFRINGLLNNEHIHLYKIKELFCILTNNGSFSGYCEKYWGAKPDSMINFIKKIIDIHKKNILIRHLVCHDVSIIILGQLVRMMRRHPTQYARLS